VHSARPRKNRVTADRIVERRNDNVRAMRGGRADGTIEIGHQRAGPLGAEGIWDRGLEAENRECSDRRQNGLQNSFAGGRRYGGLPSRRCLPPEYGDQARDTLVEILEGDVNVRCAVLRGDGEAMRFGVIFRVRLGGGDE
jgi:hypothetical protein